jgi:hypothetical protein
MRSVRTSCYTVPFNGRRSKGDRGAPDHSFGSDLFMGGFVMKLSIAKTIVCREYSEVMSSHS